MGNDGNDIRRRALRWLVILTGLLTIIYVVGSQPLRFGMYQVRRTADSRDQRFSILQLRASDSQAQVKTPPSSDFFLSGLKGDPPQTRNYTFVVSEMEGSPDGVTKAMLVVNGQYPGPTIEANQGDRLRIKVTNQLRTNRTAIHWHGLFQNGTNYYDGTAGVTECGIPVGASLTYEFDTGDFSGSTWWHAHSSQYSDGVTGALIVHPSSSEDIGNIDGDVVLELADLWHDPAAAISEQYLSGDGPVANLQLEDGNSGTINGVGQFNGSSEYFNFDLSPNKTYRLRLIHTGSAAQIRFSVDYHPLTVIEVDGTMVEPYTVSGLTLLVAQRYSVLLHTNQTDEKNGAYWMRSELLNLLPRPNVNTDIRGILRYGSKDVTSLPTTSKDPGVPSQNVTDMEISKLVPAVPDVPPERSRFYQVNFSFNQTIGGGAIAWMNTTSWDPLQGTTTLLEVHKNSTFAPDGASVQLGSQFVITEDAIQTVDILLVNPGAADHPFHLHGHRPWILGSGAFPYRGEEFETSNSLRRDTFIVPAQGWTMFRFVTDNPGLWALHCHVAWHMSVGLVMQISSQPSKVAKMVIPDTIVDQCGK